MKKLNRIDIIHILNGLENIKITTLYEILSNINKSLYIYVKSSKKTKNEILDLLIKLNDIKKYEITNYDSILYKYLYYNKIITNKYSMNLFKNNKIRNTCILIKGKRDYMEDNILIKDDKNYFLSLVLDGHGGEGCSKYFKLNFLETMKKNIKNDYMIGIKNTINILNNKFLNYYNQSGSTLNLLFIDKNNKKYYIYNIGDSRCICLTKNNKIIQLSTDHRPTNNKEKEYIKMKGGFVKYNRVNGILAVSRALGDKKLKDVINPNPEIISGKIDNIKYFFQGTDGIFDYISNKNIIEYIEKSSNIKYYNNVIYNLMNYILTKKKSQDNLSCSFTLIK